MCSRRTDLRIFANKLWTIGKRSLVQKVSEMAAVRGQTTSTDRGCEDQGRRSGQVEDAFGLAKCVIRSPKSV